MMLVKEAAQLWPLNCRRFLFSVSISHISLLNPVAKYAYESFELFDRCVNIFFTAVIYDTSYILESFYVISKFKYGNS